MNSYQTLLRYAVYLLARRCYSEAEMTKKLRKKNLGADEEVTKVIDRLKELKYLDDENYTRLFIDTHLRQKPQGIRLLKLNLQKKGVAKDQIAKVFEQKDIDELKFAQEAMEKKLKTLSRFDRQKQKEKLYRFLASRGFKNDTIVKVLL